MRGSDTRRLDEIIENPRSKPLEVAAAVQAKAAAEMTTVVHDSFRSLAYELKELRAVIGRLPLPKP
jgi:hypothetical protein